MKRALYVLFVILSVLAVSLISCSNEVSVETEGTLVISIAGGQSRGLLPTVSMNVAQYSLTVTNSSGEEVARKSLDAGTTSMSYRLPAGTYTVRIDALNNEGTVIGSGETSATVTAGGTNSVTVTIRELEGNGVFAVSISANDGYELTLKLYNPAGEEVYTGDLVYAGGRYVTDGQVVLGNGFYGFSIFRNDTGAVVKSDSIRIVKDYTTTYSAEFTFQSDGSLAIINEMVDIPTIKITLEKSVLGVEDNLEAVAEVSGISDYTACWLIDGVPVGAFGEYADLSQAVEGLEEGEHEVALCVRNSQIMWAESEVFIVGYEGGTTLSLSRLVAGGSIDLSELSADSRIELSDFSLEDGIYIEVTDTSRGISRGFGDVMEGISNLFRRQDGTFIPLPDTNGRASISGASLGIVDTARVVIHRLEKLDFDLEIDPDEPKYKGYDRQLAEEYYYINFLIPEFWDLDPSEIVIVESGSEGAQGISLLQNGYLNCSVNGIYDFSNKLITGFAVNMHKVLDGNGYDRTMKLNILNPIHIDRGPVTIEDDVNVILVEKKDSQQYKVVISFVGDNAEELIRNFVDNHMSMRTFPRYTDGSHRSMIYPEINLVEKTVTLHLGVVDRDFMFTLDFDSDNTGFTAGSARVSILVDEEGFEVHDLNEIEEVEFVAEEPGYITWAFTADEEVRFDAVRDNFQFEISSFVISNSGMGSGSGMGQEQTMIFGSDRPDEVDTGFFLLKYTGKESNLPKTLFTMTKSGLKYLECLDIAWNPETEDYVCINDDCEVCRAAGEKKHYSGGFLQDNREVIFDDVYWTADEYGEYGKIGYRKNMTVRLSSGLFRKGSRSTTGNARRQYGLSTLQWSVDDTEKQVEICLTKVLLSQNKIVCAIAFGGSTDFIAEVEMTPGNKRELTELTVEGTPVVQRELSPVDPSGLTVIAHFSDGSETDVTDQAVFTTDSDSDTWGSILNYTDGRWEPDYNWHEIRVSYSFNGLTITIATTHFGLHAKNDVNTIETAYELPIRDNSYLLLDVFKAFRYVVDPLITDDPPAGYLIEGTSAGNNAVMIFPYDSYVDDSPVDINTFYGLMVSYDVKLEDDGYSPAFNWYSSNYYSSMLVFSINGNATPATAVVVYGKLANDIDPAVGIKRSDFVADTTKTFFVKTVTPTD